MRRACFARWTESRLSALGSGKIFDYIVEAYSSSLEPGAPKPPLCYTSPAPMSTRGFRGRVQVAYGPKVLERAHAYLARHARLVIVAILAYIIVAGLVQAANRRFWFDEIFTVAIARLGSMTDVWQALASAADTSPPRIFVIVFF